MSSSPSILATPPLTSDSSASAISSLSRGRSWPRSTRARFLDALGYRYADTNGLFDHLNAVVALTPDLQPAKFLLGTTYSARDIDDALRVASGQRDWIGKYGGVLIALLLLIALLSLIYIVSMVGTHHATAYNRA